MDEFEELPKMAGWHEANLTMLENGLLSISNPKPNYNITFHNSDDTGVASKQVGRLDFNGPELIFEGDAAESAKVFIDWIAKAFHGRMLQEYERGYNDAKQGKSPQQ